MNARRRITSLVWMRQHRATLHLTLLLHITGGRCYGQALQPVPTSVQSCLDSCIFDVLAVGPPKDVFSELAASCLRFRCSL